MLEVQIRPSSQLDAKNHIKRTLQIQSQLLKTYNLPRFPRQLHFRPLGVHIACRTMDDNYFFLNPFPCSVDRLDANYYMHGSSAFCLIPIALCEAPDLIYWPVLKTCYEDRIMNVCWLFCHATLVLLKCLANKKWILIEPMWTCQWHKLLPIPTNEEIVYR